MAIAVWKHPCLPLPPVSHRESLMQLQLQFFSKFLRGEEVCVPLLMARIQRSFASETEILHDFHKITGP